MKVNAVLLIIAIGIAVLLGFLVYSFCSSSDNACALGVTSALSFAVTLSGRKEKGGCEMPRTAEIKRDTKETKIFVKLNIIFQIQI